MSERRRPPNRCAGITRKLVDERVDAGGLVVHARVDLYDDGFPCQIFLAGPKPGSPVANLLEDIGVVVSVAIQYGVPLDALARSIGRLPAFDAPAKPEELDLPPADAERRRPASILGSALDYMVEVYRAAELVHAGGAPAPAEEIERLARINAFRTPPKG